MARKEHGPEQIVTLVATDRSGNRQRKIDPTCAPGIAVCAGHISLQKPARTLDRATAQEQGREAVEGTVGSDGSKPGWESKTSPRISCKRAGGSDPLMIIDFYTRESAAIGAGQSRPM